MTLSHLLYWVLQYLLGLPQYCLELLIYYKYIFNYHVFVIYSHFFYYLISSFGVADDALSKESTSIELGLVTLFCSISIDSVVI